MKLPKILSSRMVLQRDVENTIWGFEAVPNGKVTVELDGQMFEGIADSNGNFEVTIGAKKAGESHSIKVSDYKADEVNTTVVLEDVLFGDVYLLAGQSNMELPVSRTLDYSESYAKSIDNSSIRHFEVPKEALFGKTASDFSGGEWQYANQEHVYNFSALGFYYADLINRDNNIPVGLIQTAVGGAHIESIMSEERLLTMADKLQMMAKSRGESLDSCDCGNNSSCKVCYKEKLELDKDLKNNQEINAREVQAQNDWFELVDSNDLGIKNHWENGDFTPDREINIPDMWEEKYRVYSDLLGIRGAMWLSRDVELTKEQAQREAKLSLGVTVDVDFAYVNGHMVGRTYCRYDHSRYDIPKGILKEGTNKIVIRLITNIKDGGFQPEQPYYLRVGEEKLRLDGTWNIKLGYKVPAGVPEFKDTTFYFWRPAAMYNQMIYPLKNLKLKAMMFYQGESNGNHAWEYEYLFREFVDMIRELFDSKELPIMYIQLPYWGQEGDTRHFPGWEELREAQKRASDIPGVTMVDIYDLGAEYDLHPQNKQMVAQRVYEQWRV